ncbi:MAG TPA: hypothetical protein VLF16_15705 [Pseudomonas sp.]|nr:hypothetical protein [Pseudomonas sp.]
MSNTETKLVVALRMGFYGGAEKRPGDEFLVDGDDEATWFKPVKTRGKNKIDGDSVRAQLGEPASMDPRSAIQTANLTGDEDHDKPVAGEEFNHGDKLTGFEIGKERVAAQDPDTLSKLAKQPVVTPTDLQPARTPAPPMKEQIKQATGSTTPAKK